MTALTSEMQKSRNLLSTEGRPHPKSGPTEVATLLNPLLGIG